MIIRDICQFKHVIIIIKSFCVLYTYITSLQDFKIRPKQTKKQGWKIYTCYVIEEPWCDTTVKCKPILYSKKI